MFGKDYTQVSMQELLGGLGKMEASMSEDPVNRDFGGLKRDSKGNFNDDDLVKILTESIEDCAGKSMDSKLLFGSKMPTQYRFSRSSECPHSHAR